MKNSNDVKGNRTRDLPNCSAVPQPTAIPRAPILICSYTNCRVFIRTCVSLRFFFMTYTVLPALSTETYLIFRVLIFIYVIFRIFTSTEEILPVLPVPQFFHVVACAFICSGFVVYLYKFSNLDLYLDEFSDVCLYLYTGFRVRGSVHLQIFNKKSNQMHNQSYIYCFVA
jgi:hypothetical protein